jgi:hypothetical protein
LAVALVAEASDEAHHVGDSGEEAATLNPSTHQLFHIQTIQAHFEPLPLSILHHSTCIQRNTAIMSTSPHQLFLLADHIKLSLLERQRAQSLKLPSNNKTDGPITRSLESLRAGLEILTAQVEEQESADGE